MEEYKDQIGKWWNLEVRFHDAIKVKMWLEAISLAYILLELRLRLLLRTTRGTTGRPTDRKEIDAQRYLMDLVTLAEKNGFLETKLAERISEFNRIRRDAIHGLIQERIEYKDLETAARIYSQLTLPLQEAMGIRITLGPVETYEEYVQKHKNRKLSSD